MVQQTSEKDAANENEVLTERIITGVANKISKPWTEEREKLEVERKKMAEEANKKKAEEEQKKKAEEEQKKKAEEEANKVEQDKKNKSKVIKHMNEEDQEAMEERKFEKWLKKNKFQENVEKTARITEENQGQIKDISNEIANVKDGLGSPKKPIAETLGDLCNGVDCIKKDVENYSEKQSNIDKKLDTGLGELKERIEKLEEPTFTCDNCGADGIRPLSSYCPNCGAPIHSWKDDAGQPVKGWVPYWRRVAQVAEAIPKQES